MVMNHQIKTSLEFSLKYAEHCSVFQLILMGVDSFGSFSLVHSQAAKQVNSFNLSPVAGRVRSCRFCVSAHFLIIYGCSTTQKSRGQCSTNHEQEKLWNFFDLLCKLVQV